MKAKDVVVGQPIHCAWDERTYYVLFPSSVVGRTVTGTLLYLTRHKGLAAEWAPWSVGPTSKYTISLAHFRAPSPPGAIIKTVFEGWRAWR